MSDYKLAPNESIILQHDSVKHNDKYADLILTNRNLVWIESNGGIFKTVYSEYKLPLNEIKVASGQAQVYVEKENDYWVLQVLHKNGVERFKFYTGLLESLKKKAEVENWMHQISILITGRSSDNVADVALVSGVKNALGSFGLNLKGKQPEAVTGKCIGCMAPLSGMRGRTVRCKYCDTEQSL